MVEQGWPPPANPIAMGVAGGDAVKLPPPPANPIAQTLLLDPHDMHIAPQQPPGAQRRMRARHG